MNGPPLNAKPPAGDQGQAHIESEAAGNVVFPTEYSSGFTPDLLAIAKIVQRARRQSPEPKPMVVFPDCSEVIL